MNPHMPLRQRASRVFTWIFYHVVDYGPILDMNLHLLSPLPSGVLNLLEGHVKRLRTLASPLTSQSPRVDGMEILFPVPRNYSSPTAQSPRVSSPTFLVPTPSGPFIDPTRERQPKKVTQRSVDDQAKINRMECKRGESLAKAPSAAWRVAFTVADPRRTSTTNGPPDFVPNSGTLGDAVLHLDADLTCQSSRDQRRAAQPPLPCGAVRTDVATPPSRN